MASVIVIGVGSTGLHVMEQAQKFYYEFTKKDAPNANNAAFLFIETDGAKEVEKTPNGTTAIKSTNLSFQNIDATLGNWHETNNVEWKKWMPTAANVLASHTGAAGQPAYGRIALWANEQSVSQQIQSVYQQVGGNSQTNIYIVGSLTGGTGTGVFLDLAYMIKNLTQNNNIYGMFLLPDKNSVGDQTIMSLYENAYSSLRTLDYHSKPDVVNNTNFNCTYPSGKNVVDLSAPFYNVQFFTKDFSDAQASLPSLSNLVRSVGFNLVLRLLDVTNQAAPFQDVVNAKLVDYNSKVPKYNGVFTTIGFNMFQYPETLLEEYFSANLLETELLNRWVDNNAFVDKNGVKQPISSVNGKIKIETAKFVETSIADVISKSMNNPILASSTVKREVEKEVNNILNGNIVGVKENYLYSLFNPQANKANFYSAINDGQSFNLRDYLIETIVSQIETISTEYQNINVVKMYIDSIATAINNLLVDWQKRLKLDGTPMTWNKVWGEMAKTITGTEMIYIIVNAKREYYVDSLMEMVKLCYINAFIPMLQNISDSLTKGDILQTTSGVKLATIKDAEHINVTLNNLLDPQKSDSLVSRKNNIGGELSQNKNPQLNFLFSGDNYQADINNANQLYNNQAKRLDFSVVCGGLSLWKYLLDRTVLDVRSDMIKQGLLFIQGLNLFVKTDIVSLMENIQPQHPLYNKVKDLLTQQPAVIRQRVPAMVSLVNSEKFYDHICLKLIVVSPLADIDVAGIVNKMVYKTSPNTSDFVQLPSMKNTVVVYQEYGYLGQVGPTVKTFNPLLHLSYQSQVLNALKDQIQSGNFDESLRLAYIDAKTLLDTDNIKIK